MMIKPAFIVDGFTELKIVQFLCPNSPVKRTDINGKDVKIHNIAKKIASHIRLLGDRYYPIIILIDKEQRKVAFDEMANQIRECISNEGIKDQDLRIGVADRMIENWIVADWDRLRGNITIDKPDTTDDINGAAVIKKIKKSYDKTTDGVEYFKSARQSVMYNNSPSYKYFIDQLDDIPCIYLNFQK